MRRNNFRKKSDRAIAFPSLLLGCFVLLTGSLLVGCTSDREELAISFIVFGDPAEFAAYETLVATFQELHPDITLQLRHIPSQSEYRRQLATDFSGGAPPDVMLLNYRRFAHFAEQGALEPLEDYLANSPLIQESDFFPEVIESFHYEDTLWCLPQNVSSLVVYYNKDLFDATELPYPTTQWTWDDFLDLARALTQDMDHDGTIDQYGVGIAPSFFRLAPFIWQNGGELVDDPTNPTRLALDSPQAMAAFQWFVDLQIKEHVVPDAVAEAVEKSEVRFLNGRLAMMFNSRRGVPTYRTITDFAWDTISLPVGQTAAGILHSDAYCMAAATKNKEAAWTFIEFANSAQGQEVVATSGRTVPSLIAVANSPYFLDPNQPPANGRIFIDTISIIRRVPIMANWVGVEEAVGKEIERAFYGQVSLEEAVETANSLTRTYFEQTK